MTKIVFYDPKSFSASFIGVIINMFLLVGPMLFLVWNQSGTENSAWTIVLIGLPVGIFLMFISEPIVYPIVGIKHEFMFSEEFVEIIAQQKKEKIALKDVKIKAFEVPTEDSSIKHVVIEWAEDKKIDIFETWVTGNTMKDFNTLFFKYLPPKA